jgi:hypothetical protein
MNYVTITHIGRRSTCEKRSAEQWTGVGRSLTMEGT